MSKYRKKPGRKKLPKDKHSIKKTVQFYPDEIEYIEKIQEKFELGFSKAVRGIINGYKKMLDK